MSATIIDTGDALDPTATSILAAARSAVLDFGVRRVTLSEVASRAGVSRMTVYNRFGDLESLVRALIAREFLSRIDWIARERDWRRGRERLVSLLARAARQLPANPLLRKVRASEPELLTPFVFQGLGATQQTALELISRAVAAGQRDGSIRSGSVEAIAAAALLIAQSFVFSATTIETAPRDELLRGLELALEGLLSPNAGGA